MTQKLTYTKYYLDTPNTCFYCGGESKGHNDYVPPKDCLKHESTRALCPEDPVTVNCCHNCKSLLYPDRFKLLTVASRVQRILNKRKRISPSPKEMLQQMKLGALNPWQAMLENGEVIDLPDYQLSLEVIEAKRRSTKPVENDW